MFFVKADDEHNSHNNIHSTELTLMQKYINE